MVEQTEMVCNERVVTKGSVFISTSYVYFIRQSYNKVFDRITIPASVQFSPFTTPYVATVQLNSCNTQTVIMILASTMSPTHLIR